MSGKSYWPPRNHQNYAVAGDARLTAGTNQGHTVRQNEPAQRPPSPTIRRSTNMEAPFTGGKRKTIGGRGREWAHHCHKLLESMRERDDSIHFRNPVDSLKYKGYYSVVENDIDLSHVLLKFHGGRYDSPEEFGDDIKLMFNNWKLFCSKNPNRHQQVNHDVHQLSFWFEMEFAKIMDNWKIQSKGLVSSMYSKRLRQNDSPSPSASYPPATATSVKVDAVALSSSPKLQLDSRTLVSIQKNGSLSIVHQNQSKGTEAATSTRKSTPVLEQQHSADHLLPDSPMSPTPLSTDPLATNLELKMESTSIWFGPCRSRPARPIVLTEEGFAVPLTASDNSVHNFNIKSSEIVRCCGHLNKNKKHTLFIFITPPCENRLKEMSLAHNLFSSKPDKEPCSIIAMFIKCLDPNKCAKLVYIFWMMSRSNIFGSLFSEVDTNGALQILAYIKPQIVGRVNDRVNPSDSTDTRENVKKTLETLKARKASTSSDTSKKATVTSATVSTPPVSASESPPPPLPDRVLEPPASPEPSERGNPPRVPTRASAATRRLSEERRDSPLSPQPTEQLAISDDDDLAIIDDPNGCAKPEPTTLTIEDDTDDVMISEQHFSIKCPITQLTMTCPVRNQNCKHNYDRIGVEELLKNRGEKARCPVPGCSNNIALHMQHMFLDHELKAFIDSRK